MLRAQMADQDVFSAFVDSSWPTPTLTLSHKTPANALNNTTTNKNDNNKQTNIQNTASSTISAVNNNHNNTGLSVVSYDDDDDDSTIFRCSICNTPSTKYRCPGCNRYNCSLLCINQHKTKYKCNGKRKLSAYIPLNKIDTYTVSRDAHLLDDIGSVISASQRNTLVNTQKNKDNIKLYNRSYAVPSDLHLSNNTSTYTQRDRILLNICANYSIYLSLVPNTMSLHKNNTSVANIKQQNIKWKIDIKLYNTDIVITKHKLEDSTVWKDIIRDVIEPIKNNATQQHSNKSQRTLRSYNAAKPNNDNITHDNPIIQQYIDSDIDKFHILMLLPFQPFNDRRYYTLNNNDTIRQSLQYKRLIEYPQVIIVHDNDINNFNTNMPDTVKPSVNNNNNTTTNNQSTITITSNDNTLEEGEIE